MQLVGEEACVCEELYDLYSANIIRVSKSIRMRRVGHVLHMVERRGAYMVFMGRPGEGDHVEYPGIDGRIILKWMFMK